MSTPVSPQEEWSGPDGRGTITEQLSQRTSRPPDYASQNVAITQLARALGKEPGFIFQKVSEAALQLSSADSTGIFILEEGRESAHMRCQAAVGLWKEKVGERWPVPAIPCGITMKRNRPMLFDQPGLHFPSLDDVNQPAHEALSVPINIDEEPIGTIWAVTTDPSHRFDREDARLLGDLAPFAAAAFTLLQQAKSVQQSDQARVAALNLMEDAIHSTSRAEEALSALRISEERFRLLVETVADHAIMLLDPAGKVSSWNKGAQRILGYRCPEILGQAAAIFFPPELLEAGWAERELSIAMGTGHASDENWLIRRDGTRFWASGTTTALRDEQGKLLGFVKILRDLSERKAAEDALQQSNQRLAEALEVAEHASQAKDRFLATLSHELRTPLMPILMASSMLLEDSGLDESVRRSLSMIQRNVELEARMIDDLVDVSRIINNKLQISREPVDLHDVVLRAVEVCAPSAAAKEIPIEVHLDSAGARIEGDPVRLQQVVWNLIQNGVKFTPPGGRVSVRTFVTEERIGISVDDTGRGIPGDLLEAIFDAFEQGGRVSRECMQGLGLGLAIAKRIVELHGGTIAASSPGPGAGATFFIELPLHGTPPVPTPDNAK